MLDRHLQFANVRGIRNFGEGDYLVDPAWRRGFAELGPRNLVSCLDTRIERAADLARPRGDVSGHDDLRRPLRDSDGSATRPISSAGGRRSDDMAEAPNVVMKISGLGMGDPLWTVESIRPYVLGCIEAFGADRVVFGTNWPVDRMFSSYPDLINAYAEIISGFSRDEQVSDVLRQCRTHLPHLRPARPQPARSPPASTMSA